MPKGIPNNKYTGEFKQMVVETMRKENLSYREATREFGIGDHNAVAKWERIWTRGFVHRKTRTQINRTS